MLWIRQAILNSLAASAIFCMTVATPRSLLAQTSANQGQLTSPASGVFVSGTLGTQSPFLGSVLTGKPTGTVRPLSLGDALDRGLKDNLGLIESDLSTRTARAERLKTLSELPLTSTTSGCWESPR